MKTANTYIILIFFGAKIWNVMDIVTNKLIKFKKDDYESSRMFSKQVKSVKCKVKLQLNFVKDFGSFLAFTMAYICLHQKLQQKHTTIVKYYIRLSAD